MACVRPVLSITGCLQLIEEDLSECQVAAGGSEHLGLLRSTQREIRRLGSLVSDFLTYARPSTPRRAPCSLDATVRDGVQLFEAAAHIGAILGGLDEAAQARLAACGRHIGTAFQLIDDVLDYSGDEAATGKHLGDDLAEGKPTLPLLIAMERGTAEERQLIRHAIEAGEVERLADIVSIVRRTGAIDATRDAALVEADKARECLSSVPAGSAREALLELCDRSVRRSS